MKVLDRKERLDAVGAEAVFVVHDDPASVRQRLLAELEVPFPVVVDRARDAYRAWGLGRSSFSSIWLSPRVWASYAKLLAGGERWLGLGEDPLQLGGDFVVDRRGVVTYSRPQLRDDRPPVTVLLAELARAAGNTR